MLSFTYNFCGEQSGDSGRCTGNMYGNNGMHTTADEDEIMVFDWNNAAVPRPVGTERLHEGLPLHQYQYPGVPTYPHVSHQAMSSNYSYSADFNTFHGTTYNGGSFSQATYPNHRNHYDYSFNYHQPVQSSYQNVHTNQNPVADWDWQNYNPNGSSFSRQSNGISTGTIQKPDEDDDWQEIEEFDYSAHGYRYAQSEKPSDDKVPVTGTKDTGKKSKSVTFAVPESSVPLDEVLSGLPNQLPNSAHKVNTSKSATLAVPQSLPSVTADKTPTFVVTQPSLPLNEVLSGLPNPVTGPSVGAWKSRKRPRSVMEKSETSDLTSFLSKNTQRASARSYARPSKKANSTASITSSISDSSTANDKQSQLPTTQDDNEINSTALSDISQDSSEDQDNHENLVTVSPVTLNSINESIQETDNIICESDESEEELGKVTLKIRTDIFEDEDEDED